MKKDSIKLQGICKFLITVFEKRKYPVKEVVRVYNSVKLNKSDRI